MYRDWKPLEIADDLLGARLGDIAEHTVVKLYEFECKYKYFD